MEKTQGVVIRSVDYKEKDRILTLFTPCGLKTVTARGVRSEKSKLRHGTNVLSFGDFTYGGKKSDAMILSGAEIVDSFYEAWQDVDKMSAASYCFELTEKCFRGEEDSAKEFVFLLRTLKEITYGQTSPAVAAFAYSVFCARSLGVDYTEIATYDGEAYGIVETFAVADPEEAETLVFDKEKTKHAFLLLHNVFKNFLGVRIASFQTLLGRI